MKFGFSGRSAFNIIVIVFVLLIIGQLYSARLNRSPAQLEDCKTLVFNGNDKLNIVFFSPGEKAKTYSEFLKTIVPFDEYRNNFNFYYIEGYVPKCEIYKGVATLCYSRQILEKASSCPNDYVVVLDDQPVKIRSSSYLNVMSLNVRHPLTVFAHEFGHAFLGLAEEYTTATLPRNPLNCKSSCEGFDGEVNGCFEGCSREDYFRSVENGIMRTLSSKEFGIFNDNLFRKKLEKETGKAITTNAINIERDCSNEKYYLIEGYYDPEYFGSIVIDKSLEVGCAGGNGAGGSKYEIYTGDELAGSGEFGPELLFTDGIGKSIDSDIEGETFSDGGRYILKIPYLDGQEKLVISDEYGTSTIDLEGTYVDSERIYNEESLQDLAVSALVLEKKEEIESEVEERRSQGGEEGITKEEAIRKQIVEEKKVEIEMRLNEIRDELVSEAIAKGTIESYESEKNDGNIFRQENEESFEKKDDDNELTFQTNDNKLTVQAIKEFGSANDENKLRVVLFFVIATLLVSFLLRDLQGRDSCKRAP